jgi:nucleoside-diphosphate kinase
LKLPNIKLFNMERTIVLVKPDGVQRGLIGEIIHRFERKGLKLSALKMMNMTDEIIDAWYAHHREKPFFPSLKAFMTSYPIVAMVWEGQEAVSVIRKMIGITLARQAEPGTIRGDFAISTQMNLIHASESVEAAEKELNILFAEGDLFSWERTDALHLYGEEERS